MLRVVGLGLRLGAVFSEVARARGTSRAAASAIARSASGSRLVYVSAVTVIEEWPSISWMSFRPAPATWASVAAP